MASVRQFRSNSIMLSLLGPLSICATIVSAGTGAQSLDPIAVESSDSSTFSLESASARLAAESPSTQPAADAPRTIPYDPFTSKTMTGTWGGVRTELEDAGLTFAPLLVAIYQQNYHGGVNTHHAHDIAGKMYWNIEYSFEKAELIPGASMFFRAIQTWNDGVRRDAGMLYHPFFSNGSSGDQALEIDKWWWRQRLFDDRLEFRLGKILNIGDHLDYNAYAGNYVNQFNNQALYYNPTIPVVKGLGATLKVWPVDWLYFTALALDANTVATHNRHGTGGFDTAFSAPCQYFAAWEFGLAPKWDIAEQQYPGNYRFGWWYHPRKRNTFKNTLGGALANEQRNGEWGFYFNFDQLVFKENAEPTDKQGLGLFARYGYAHGDVNQIEHFWSVGSQYQGLIPTRDKDLLGFGVGQSIMSKDYRRVVNHLADRETIYELYYALEVTPWCIITPDLQLITNPGGNKNARDALVGGLRVKIVF